MPFEVGYYWVKRLGKKKHYALLLNSFSSWPSFFYLQIAPFITSPKSPRISFTMKACVLRSFSGGVPRGGEEERVTRKRFQDCWPSANSSTGTIQLLQDVNSSNFEPALEWSLTEHEKIFLPTYTEQALAKITAQTWDQSPMSRNMHPRCSDNTGLGWSITQCNRAPGCQTVVLLILALSQTTANWRPLSCTLVCEDCRTLSVLAAAPAQSWGEDCGSPIRTQQLGGSL